MKSRSPVRPSSQTRSLVFDAIRAAGPISRVELAAKCALTEATISNVVRIMLLDGLVVETGFSGSTGGKRRTLLEVNSAARFAVGVSLDREDITLVVSDLSGRMLGTSKEVGTGDTYPGIVVKAVAGAISDLLRDNDVDRSAVVGIGVASPGPLDTRRGVLRGQRPSSAWRDYPLEERLEDLTGLRVVLDNDATCAALGEFWTNRSVSTAPVSATVYMADGIGCGILIDGRIFHGTSSNAGELGHISLDTAGPVCQCGSRGCVEMYASPGAVAAAALADPHLVAELALTPKVASSRDNYSRIAHAAVNGNRRAEALVSAAAVSLAEGLITLTNILDLDRVTLSGPGFSVAGPIFTRVIGERLTAGIFMREIHPVQTLLSSIGEESAAVGAAAMALQHEVTPHLAVSSRRPSALA